MKKSTVPFRGKREKMKKIIFCLIIIVISSSLFSSTWSVGPGGGYDFLTIQAAISDISVQSGDNINVYPDTYNSIDYGSKSLDITAVMGQSTITSNSGYVVNMGTANSSALYGFEITTPYSASGIYIEAISNIEIQDCNFNGLNKAIEVVDQLNGTFPSADVENCSFEDNDYCIYVNDNPSWSNYNIDIDIYSCTFSENDVVAYMNGCGSLYLFSCLLHDNESGFDMADNRYNFGYLDRCTITENTYGFEWSSTAFFEINNSIVYDNTTNFSGTPYDLEIEYSDIEGGYTGTGNIDQDPLFCPAYPYEYFVMEGSPCIDTGDSIKTDPDSTRYDMGWYVASRDVKYCEGNHWNWVSFPRLYRDDNDPVDIVPVLEDFLDWDFELDMLFEQIFYSVPYLGYTFLDEWEPGSRNVTSSLGYKLYAFDSGDHYLPLQESLYMSTRLPDDWELTYTLEDSTDNWMGYWLPYTQNIEDAFGDFWDDVYSVSSEDWYYEYSIFETPSSSTTNKNMVYGKGYVIVFETDIEDFCWTDATSGRSYGSPGNPEPKPQYFEFADLPNYEAIDIMEIPSNVVEIGVYEEDDCIGAVVVQEEDEQILAYSTNANRDNVPLTFQVVTTNRGENLAVSDYRVMNKETGRWENRSLISGSQKSSVVMFGNLEEPATPNSSFQISNLSNYPNPFNPTTTISFDLSSELTEDTEITIYNMKGQKVKTLPIPQSQSLSVSVTWDGTDDEGKNVSSGLYFYKVRLRPDSSGKTADHEYSKKMLLLK